MTTPHKHAELLKAFANNCKITFTYTNKNRKKHRGSGIFSVLKYPNRDWSIKVATNTKPESTQVLVTVNGRPYRVAKNSRGAKHIVRHLKKRGICAKIESFVSPL